MRAEHVNAFLVPSVEVLQKMAQTAVRVGKVARLRNSRGGEGLHIIIGLNGGLSGSVVLSLGEPVAWALASRIDHEEHGPDAEEDVIAVLSELANTIVGNATGYLYDLGLTEGITPPTVVRGSDLALDFADGSESVSIPLETELGSLEMIVSLSKS